MDADTMSSANTRNADESAVTLLVDVLVELLIFYYRKMKGW
jgi:hypothetical protein